VKRGKKFSQSSTNENKKNILENKTSIFEKKNENND
jgi:hypothetical protein